MQQSPFQWMQVGHWTDETARTGVTVVRFADDVVASGEVRGGAPATREFALLEPTKLVETIHAVCISGGSAFGLAAADGVARSLRNDGVGFETKHGRVPIVVGMSLYDLGVGASDVWPSADHGSAALETCAPSFEVGQVGAGTGATLGKWRGPDAASPGGVGFAVASKGDAQVAALIVVNAVGEIADPKQSVSSEILSGDFDWPEVESPLGENTTIGVVATNALIGDATTKAHCRSIAEAGHDGLARALIPAHGPSDGDALVAVAKPEVELDLATARLLAAAAVEQAIVIAGSKWEAAGQRLSRR